MVQIFWLSWEAKKALITQFAAVFVCFCDQFHLAYLVEDGTAVLKFLQTAGLDHMMYGLDDLAHFFGDRVLPDHLLAVEDAIGRGNRIAKSR